MKHKNKEKHKDSTDLNELLEKLVQQKDELFDQTFLTEEDRNLIESLPEEQREAVRQALLVKGELFQMLKSKLQRISADYANYQKRISKQIADTINYEKETVIKSLLPAMDNFEHILNNATSAENVESIIEGVKIIYNQMLDILKSHNVEQIKAAGEKFDPSFHNALMQRSEQDKQDNIILEEFQKGYKLNGRVIRPSRVVVNKLAPNNISEERAPDNNQAENDTDTGEDETADME